MAVDGGDFLIDTYSPRPDRRRGVLATVAVVAVFATLTAVAISGLGDRPGRPAQVVAGSDPPLTLPPPRAMAVGVDVQVPPGWQTLRAEGQLLVVATRPLETRDLALALLARDDAAFAAFPADGTVFVVGSDRLKAKYLGVPSVAGAPAGGAPSPSASGTPVGAVGGPVPPVEITAVTVDSFVGPGPALALGEPKTLRGGVTVRRGDVPQSIVVLAAYAGPRAPASQMREAEAMAAAVKIVAPPPGATPPPPPGSRPGFDAGGVDLPHEQLAATVSFAAPGVTYAAKAQADCAVVVKDRTPQPVAGGCQVRPPSVTVVAVTPVHGPPPLPPPGARLAPGTVTPWADAVVVLARVGPDVRRLTAILIDGRTTDLTLGADGWALGATDGRVFLLEARDRAGKLLAVTAVA